MQPLPANSQTIVIIGDVHSRIRLARAALILLEEALQVQIHQVLSVGDLGLFLETTDWAYLTGPKRHRHPERSPEIREAWNSWPWPLAMIGGNHEPFHRFRASGAASFGRGLVYVDAGELPVQVPGVRVAGLSGIHHGSYLSWPASTASWADVAAVVCAGRVSRKHLTYYRDHDLAVMNRVAPNPEILLTHDWPMQPPGTQPVLSRRPEGELLAALTPRYHFSGHWHRIHAERIGTTEFRGLNIITDTGTEVLPGWAYVLASTDGTLTDVGSWPPQCLPRVVGPPKH